MGLSLGDVFPKQRNTQHPQAVCLFLPLWCQNPSKQPTHLQLRGFQAKPPFSGPRPTRKRLVVGQFVGPLGSYLVAASRPDPNPRTQEKCTPPKTGEDSFILKKSIVNGIILWKNPMSRGGGWILFFYTLNLPGPYILKWNPPSSIRVWSLS